MCCRFKQITNKIVVQPSCIRGRFITIFLPRSIWSNRILCFNNPLCIVISIILHDCMHVHGLLRCQTILASILVTFLRPVLCFDNWVQSTSAPIWWCVWADKQSFVLVIESLLCYQKREFRLSDETGAWSSSMSACECVHILCMIGSL